MKVLLTGNLGYLGTVMNERLQKDSHEVTGLDTAYYASSIIGPKPVDPPTLCVDIRDVTPELLKGYDAVIHLAALSNDPLGALNPELTYDINYKGSVNLAKAAKEAGVHRFLYASSCSVYGASGDDLVNESAEFAPASPYAESKVYAEGEILKLADDNFSPVALRNATAFGFSPRLRADIVLNNLVGHALLEKKILVMSDGTPWRPLVHALDIADVFAEVLKAPQENIHAKALNVGTEENNVQVSDIAEEVAKVVPDAELVITGESGGDPRSYRVDFSALREALPNYECKRTVAFGARELADAYLKYGLDDKGFNQSFVRLKVLQEKLANGELTDDLYLVN